MRSFFILVALMAMVMVGCDQGEVGTEQPELKITMDDIPADLTDMVAQLAEQVEALQAQANVNDADNVALWGTVADLQLADEDVLERLDLLESGSTPFYTVLYENDPIVCQVTVNGYTWNYMQLPVSIEPGAQAMFFYYNYVNGNQNFAWAPAMTIIYASDCSAATFQAQFIVVDGDIFVQAGGEGSPPGFDEMRIAVMPLREN